MTIKTMLKGWLICVLTMLSFNLYAAGDPVNQLERIANNVISKLKAHQASLKSDPAYAYTVAYQEVVPYAAIDEMAKRVVPPQVWNQANASQKQRFTKAFTRMLVRTYASALSDYNDQTIRFQPVRGGAAGRSTVQVSSEIQRSDGPSISVNYRLVQRASGWRLFDLSVEGVSMLESFRSQFSDILSRGDMEGLLTALENHRRV